MRKKLTNLISLLTALMLIFSVVPVVAAESTEQPERAYEVDFDVLKDGTDEVSTADQYLQKPAKVTVENGIGYAEITLLNSSWIVKFEVEQDGALQLASLISQDADADTRTVKFQVDNIREKMNARFVVEVPGINYKGEHNVQLSFDTTGMPGGSNPADEGEAADDSNEVQLVVVKDGTDEPSSLGNYTSKTGQLNERDGAYFLTFTLFSSSMITAFQYESGEDYVDAIVLSEDKEANMRTVGIVVTDVTKKQNVALEVDTGPRGVMRHKAQIVINIEATEENGDSPKLVFTDVNGHWAEAAIKEAAARAIVKGYDDHTFGPDKRITRAQFAVILTNAFKLSQSTPISDVTDKAEVPDYAMAAVDQVRLADLMVGDKDGKFRPNDELTRAELAVIIAKVGKLEVISGTVPSFADTNSIPVWAQPSVAATVGAGLISGRSNNQFAPADAATRAEVATLVIKVLDNMATK